MIRQLMLNEFVKMELKRYKKLYSELQKKLRLLPEGSLTVRKGELYRAVRENGKQYVAPLRNDWALYRELKNRRYIKKGLPILKKKINACENFLMKNTLYDPKALEKNLPSQYKGIQGNLLFLDGDINPEEWAAADYKRSSRRVEKVHRTKKGKITRSKSEAMIGSGLEDRGLLFRTEQEVQLPKYKVHPDFIILLPHTRRLIYYEHLGMIDSESYIYDNLGKLREYAKVGIYLGINLVITFESENHPLSMMEVEETIDMICRMDKWY